MKKILACTLFAFWLPLSAAQLAITPEGIALPEACANLEYPPQALEKGQKGLLIMNFLVGTDGKVKEVLIVKSSGWRDLDKAGYDALYACKGFQPALLDGQPIEQRFRISYNWIL